MDDALKSAATGRRALRSRAWPGHGWAKQDDTRKNRKRKPGNSLLRELKTPEGVPIRLELASWGQRAAAVMLDVFLMYFGIIITLMVVAYTIGFDDSSSFYIMLTLSFFVVQNFYFIFFELVWRGRTPGKRILGLRVISSDGGPLTGASVLARNVMREVELFIPLMVISSSLYSSGLTKLFALLWFGVLVLLPLFNRNRLRAGDMIAGTWVVVVPKSALIADVAAGKTATASGVSTDGGETDHRFKFSREQLDQYGIYELQTLERVLQARETESARTVNEVCKKICAKIDWTMIKDPAEQRAFLQAYYSALRQHLEQKMLFGVRKEDKFDQTRPTKFGN